MPRRLPTSGPLGTLVKLFYQGNKGHSGAASTRHTATGTLHCALSTPTIKLDVATKRGARSPTARRALKPGILDLVTNYVYDKPRKRPTRPSSVTTTSCRADAPSAGGPAAVRLVPDDARLDHARGREPPAWFVRTFYVDTLLVRCRPTFPIVTGRGPATTSSGATTSPSTKVMITRLIGWRVLRPLTRHCPRSLASFGLWRFPWSTTCASTPSMAPSRQTPGARTLALKRPRSGEAMARSTQATDRLRQDPRGLVRHASEVVRRLQGRRVLSWLRTPSARQASAQFDGRWALTNGGIPRGFATLKRLSDPFAGVVSVSTSRCCLDAQLTRAVDSAHSLA